MIQIEFEQRDVELSATQLEIEKKQVETVITSALSEFIRNTGKFPKMTFSGSANTFSVNVDGLAW